MKGHKVIVGVFTYLDDLLAAVEKTKAKGLDYRVYSPAFSHEIEEATMPQKSNVRRFTLVGGITGCTAGWALAIMCSMDWPMRTSAKDIVSIPGFFVIGYEWTILFGALSTLLAMLYYCKLPHVLRKVGYDPRFSYDKFGLVVGCENAEVDEMKSKLQDSGADEVHVKDGL